MASTEAIPAKRWGVLFTGDPRLYFRVYGSYQYRFCYGWRHERCVADDSDVVRPGSRYFLYWLYGSSGTRWSYCRNRQCQKFIAVSILAWSAICTSLGFVQTSTQLLVLRFLVGVAEGGVWPAILVIISHWFPSSERGRANSYFIMNVAIASIITGPISGWLVTTFGWRSVSSPKVPFLSCSSSYGGLLSATARLKPNGFPKKNGNIWKRRWLQNRKNSAQKIMLLRPFPLSSAVSTCGN